MQLCKRTVRTAQKTNCVIVKRLIDKCCFGQRITCKSDSKIYSSAEFLNSFESYGSLLRDFMAAYIAIRAIWVYLTNVVTAFNSKEKVNPSKNLDFYHPKLETRIRFCNLFDFSENYPVKNFYFRLHKLTFSRCKINEFFNSSIPVYCF
jgi:hypothetical protein